MAFVGRHVLVAGGAGTIGTGVVLALLKQGAKVTVTSRSKEKFDALQSKLPESLRKNVFSVCASVSTEDGVKEIFEQTTKQGSGVQHVVASIGSLWQKGKLIDQPLSEFNSALQGGVVGHFLFFKQFIPYLEKQPGSTYTYLTGNASENYFAPNISLTNVASGALNGMSVAIREEHKSSLVAISDFRIYFLVQPKPDREFPASEDFLMGHDVMGEAIVGTMIKKSRGLLEVRSRKQAQQMAKELNK